MTMGQPLTGIRVLDLTQIYNGPYATFLMAMAGAEVIKVEPIGGEFLRRRDASSGAFVPFAMLNACKDSVSLNLKSDEGREIFFKLLANADVVVENYAPGVIDRLGIGYEALRAAKPDIILASGSGYGQDGAYRDYMAMDLTIQAMSGVMSVTGYPDGPPTKSGAALCDFLGGVHLFGAISTALYRRATTGEGARIDVSMLEAVYVTMASNIGMTFGARNDIPLRTGNRHGGLSLCPYNVYPSRDGYVAIICNNDNHWEGLARAMGRPDLINDPSTAKNKDRVANMEMVDQLVATFTREKGKQELLELLQAARVPTAPVRDLTEVIADPVLHERGALIDVDHPAFGNITLPRSAIRFADTPQPNYRCSPTYAADNERIYGEIGLDAKSLERLTEKGVI
ncbi:CoA transferase [Phyllobacterium sp. YR531]|uniref:CaiB/BaiF CoA transferase family protein n=1 Tax=Phyllobacterium sp. YR531 TaxID=1144343 RepID=UPI00026FB1DA|nr:CoA transferase [Phyllobacterium sp. YR531]EJN06743.1 putative acyl-CoA transferase/carnitine dehydratase [Phyllobacterium sp. YR531]